MTIVIYRSFSIGISGLLLEPVPDLPLLLLPVLDDLEQLFVLVGDDVLGDLGELLLLILL